MPQMVGYIRQILMNEPNCSLVALFQLARGQTALVHPIAIQRLFDMRNTAVAYQYAQPVVIIFQEKHLGIVTANFLKNLTPIEETCPDAVLNEHFPRIGVKLLRFLQAALRHIENIHRRIDHHILGKAPQVRNHLAKRLGGIRIVVARPREELAARLGKADVQRARQPLILLVAHDAYAAVACGICSQNRRRRILRTIIDDDKLPIPHRLRQDAVYGLAQILFAVVNRQNNGNQRFMQSLIFHIYLSPPVFRSRS